MGKRMINYSVYMMRNPLKPELPEKAYAKNQVFEVWTLEKFSNHIAEHNGVFTRGTVRGVLADMCKCLVEQLLNGNKIQLGELGTFGISISCEGAESIEAFTAKNIKAVNIRFTPGEDFENLIERATFNPVSSRIGQAATLKAEKTGNNTVDLAAAKNKGAGSAPAAPSKPATPDEGGNGADSGSDENQGSDII